MSSWFGLTAPYGRGEGFQQTVKGAAPAAGSSFSLTVDPIYRSLIVSALFTLTTDANVANRYVTLEYEGGDGSPVDVNGAAVTVSANSTQRFVGQLGRGQAEWAANTDVFFPVLGVYLDGGGTLKINVANIQVGDTLTLIRFVFNQFPTDPERWPGDES